MEISNKQKAAAALAEDIQEACVKRGFNLTIHDGKIGFVDQQEKKIVMLWDPVYKLNK